MWIDRLLASDEGRERLDEALDELWPYALGVLDDELRPELVRRVEEKLGRAMPDVEPVPRGRHEAELAELLDEMTMVRRSARERMVTARTPRNVYGGRARHGSASGLRSRRSPTPRSPSSRSSISA